MSRLLSIDPGVSWCGVAVFDLGTKELLHADRMHGVGFRDDLAALVNVARSVAFYASETISGGTISAVAMEWPQIYGKRQAGRKDPNDLLPLAGLDAAILAVLAERRSKVREVQLYRPHDWKGSKKANPTARMVITRLSSEEWRTVETAEQRVTFATDLDKCEAAGTDVGHPMHNTLDAVGVGLKFLGRLERQRVIAR